MKTNSAHLGTLVPILLAVLSSACATDRQVISQASDTHHELEPAVVEEAELKGYLQTMGQRILDSGRELHARKYGPKSHFEEDANWMFSDKMRFHFVSSDTLNAFTTGGEHMYLYTKLLETCRTEDELAAVMAHEYGHVYARHVQKGMDRQYRSLGGALAAGVGGYLLGGEEHGLEYAGYGATLAYAGLGFLNMGYTREDEVEADELGFEFFVRAGWDPEKFDDFFQQLIDAGHDTTPEALSDHPSLVSRVEAARKRARALPVEAKGWRRPAVAEGERFAAIQARSRQVASTMKKDESLEAAKTLLAAVSSCLLPEDPPEREDARKQIQKAIDDENAKQRAAAQPEK